MVKCYSLRPCTGCRSRRRIRRYRKPTRFFRKRRSWNKALSRIWRRNSYTFRRGVPRRRTRTATYQKGLSNLEALGQFFTFKG